VIRSGFPNGEVSGTITILFGFPNKVLEQRSKIRYNFYYKINKLQRSCSASRTEDTFRLQNWGES
jgi:hypothetical protein